MIIWAWGMRIFWIQLLIIPEVAQPIVNGLRELLLVFFAHE